MSKFEYKHVVMPQRMADGSMAVNLMIPPLDALGNQGWELVHLSPGRGQSCDAILKRRVSEG